MESEDVNILNNILYSASGKKLTSNWNNSNVTYDYNIYFNSTDIAVLGPKDLQMQPQFVNPSTDSAFADFHLQSTSPAINSGTPILHRKLTAIETADLYAVPMTEVLMSLPGAIR
jgi:hypothetical protein